MHPDDATALDGLICFRPDFGTEVVVRRHARHVDAGTGDVILPTVVDAADPALFVATKEERGAAVRATMVHDADPPGAVTESDELLAEQLQTHRRAIALQLRGQ